MQNQTAVTGQVKSQQLLLFGLILQHMFGD